MDDAYTEWKEVYDEEQTWVDDGDAARKQANEIHARKQITQAIEMEKKLATMQEQLEHEKTAKKTFADAKRELDTQLVLEKAGGLMIKPGKTAV